MCIGIYHGVFWYSLWLMQIVFLHILTRLTNKLVPEGINFDLKSMTQGTIQTVQKGFWFGGRKQCLVLVC